MTEWDAAGYDKRSGLQRAMAEEVLALLDLHGSDQILDVGCGNGKITAEVAARVPRAQVVGVDPSHAMIDFASRHFGPEVQPNLRFQVADARELPFDQQFDLVISLNALHWIPEQDQALRSIHRALKPGGRAQFRLVPAGERRSLENVIEETRSSPGWTTYFLGFHDPYLHLTPDQYRAAAERNGFRVLSIHTASKAWDFGSRAAFREFSSVMLAEWTRCLPDPEKPAFVEDVLDRYRRVAGNTPEDENTFKFYQMDVALARE